MQAIPQKISTSTPTVSIINTKEWTSGPMFIFAIGRFQNIQNNRDSIFIVISHKTLICVCCIGSYYSVSFYWMLCWLMIWYYYFMSWLKRHLIGMNNIIMWFLRILLVILRNLRLLIILIYIISLLRSKDILLLRLMSSWVTSKLCNLYVSWVLICCR